MSIQRKIFLFFILLFPLVEQISTENPLDRSKERYLQLHSEFSTFIQKYSSQSCVMQIFSSLSESSQCENISDEQRAKYAYDLSVCTFKKVNKPFPVCSGTEIFSCVGKLTGDLWTTYTTFSEHIDNLCFYYKTLLWEKSSEFIFQKLINSSSGILLDLKSSSEIAKNLFSSQEQFSLELKQNISNTMNKLESVNEFFENYTQTEERIKVGLVELEERILKNKNQMEYVQNFIEDKIRFLNTNDETGMNIVKIFGIVLFVQIIYCSVIADLKLAYFVLDISYALFEFYFLPQYKGSILYKYLVTLSRSVFIGVLVIVSLLKNCQKKKKKSKTSSVNNSITVSAVKNYITKTPQWMKKYNSKFDNQYMLLASQFESMKKKIKSQDHTTPMF